MSRGCLQPVVPDAAPRSPLAGEEGLVQLALESWIDGCLAEGAAAAQAARAAAVSEDGEARALHRQVAADEARHAELAWSILEWTLARGGAEVAAAVHAFRDLEAAPGEGQDFAPDGLEPHGQLGARARSALDGEHRELTCRHLDRLLDRVDGA